MSLVQEFQVPFDAGAQVPAAPGGAIRLNDFDAPVHRDDGKRGEIGGDRDTPVVLELAVDPGGTATWTLRFGVRGGGFLPGPGHDDRAGLRLETASGLKLELPLVAGRERWTKSDARFEVASCAWRVAWDPRWQGEALASVRLRVQA